MEEGLDTCVKKGSFQAICLPGPEVAKSVRLGEPPIASLNLHNYFARA